MPEARTTEMEPVWIIIGLFVVGFIIWFVARAQIVSFYFFIKRYEIEFVQFFIGGFVPQAFTQTKQIIADAALNPKAVPFHTVSVVAYQVAFYLRYFIAFVLIIFAILLYFRSSASRYKRKLTMESLRASILELWPETAPVRDVDLVSEDIEVGPWAMAMAPMRFAKKHHLLKTVAASKETALAGQNQAKAIVIRDRASRVFSMQLGKLWTNVHDLDAYTKALFAVFVTKAAHNTQEAKDLLQSIAESSRSGSLDFSGAEERIKKYENLPFVKEVTDKHAYCLTVMASLLKLARLDGVLSSSEFLWLKPVDRRLWFMLNAVGRQTVAVEVAGPFAHWLAEKKLGRRIRTPMVDQAV
ncbi:MAG: type IVB secretion system coupling complex protein DotM/IcmP, partial [Gammaproteobacteria bacterium]|nr:type IVB secretion system coupling complex protein DotM/IcmP [Gammaproteobacteria bacterium]